MTPTLNSLLSLTPASGQARLDDGRTFPLVGFGVVVTDTTNDTYTTEIQPVILADRSRPVPLPLYAPDATAELVVRS